MRIQAWPLLLLGLTGLTGCGGTRSTLAQQAEATPLPATEEDRQADCERIRKAIADERSREQMAGVMPTDPAMAQLTQRQTAQMIALLEHRAAVEQCPAAPATAGATTAR